MSGYKRVNFYELCRLCASNQQKEKTHIFHEEGRKIQLQTKIQSLLSLKVCEDDCLPKVVCSKCLQCLEECFSFRNECATSEGMLSSYFNTYRYKEDFTKTGKVYIKDTAPQQRADVIYTKEPKLEPVITASSHNPEPEIAPSYAQQEVKMKSPQVFVNVKQQPQHTPRSQPEAFTINANGELVNITPLIDFEGLVQAPPQIHQPPKKQRTSLLKKMKHEPENSIHEEGVVSFNVSDKNSSQVGKGKERVFPVKVEVEAKSVNLSSQIIVNPVPIRNITLPLGNVSSNANTSQAFQTQKIIENFNACYYTNQIEYPQVEQNLEVNQPVSALNTISPNWTENLSIPQENLLLKKSHSPEGSKLFECEICKKTFKRREHLYQHVKLHTGFRPFGCEHCKKAFMRKEHLLRHMTSHSGLKNFTCNICDKSFSRNDNLLKHKKTHEKESNFVCEICNKHFVMKHYYVAHKLTHDMENKCSTGANFVWSVKA